MKKKLLVVAAIVTMVFALAACGGGSASDYVGVWKGDKISISGSEMDIAALGVKYEMEIKEDGTCVMTIGDQTEETKWKESKNGVEISGQELKISGDKAEFEYDGSKITFVRE